VDASGEVDTEDLTFWLPALTKPVPRCWDSVDVDDSGTFDAGDLAFLLRYLFEQGPPPPLPFPECGRDTTEDELGCLSFPPCGFAASGEAEEGSGDLLSEGSARVGFDAEVSPEDRGVTVSVHLMTGEPVCAVDFGIEFDSSALEFVEMTGVSSMFDHLSATGTENRDRIRLGGFTDLELRPTLLPGDHELGRLRFNVRNPETMLSTHFTLRDAILVRPDVIETVASGEGVVVGEALPVRAAIHTPNPLRVGSMIAIELPVASHVELAIYNVQGQRIRTLSEVRMPAGRHTVSWDGRSASGHALQSGIYYIRVELADDTLKQKAIFVR